MAPWSKSSEIQKIKGDEQPGKRYCRVSRTKKEKKEKTKGKSASQTFILPASKVGSQGLVSKQRELDLHCRYDLKLRAGFSTSTLSWLSTNIK